MKKIGIIGLGKMGISHLAIAKGIGNAEIVAAADTNIFILKAIKKYSKINTYTDYKKMLYNEKLDGVIISLPNKMHYQACLDCINNNVSFFVEKPFTLNPEQSKIIIEKASAKKLKAMVGYVNRYSIIFSEIKEILQNKILGQVYNYKSSMYGFVINSDSKSSWRNRVSEGGGCLYDYGSHAIDLAIYYFGEIEEILYSDLIKIYSSEGEDFVNAFVRHKNGVKGNIYVNWCDATQRKAYNQIEIYGKNGKLIANKQEMKVYLVNCEENNLYNLKKGWNTKYVTDFSNNVPFYLRGEEYTNEILEFINMINKNDIYSKSSIEQAFLTDIAIKKIRDKANN